MPFDPNLPLPSTNITSTVLRSQFQGLKDLIDAIPGGGITGVTIDGVTTLDPGQDATAQATLVNGELHLSFGIPRGSTGEAGANGSSGSDGLPGAQGPQGPQGVPGEVTLTDLKNGLLNTLTQTSANSNGVDVLPNSFSDPDAETLRLKVNELINALRR